MSNLVKEVQSHHLLDHLLRMSSGKPIQSAPSDDLFENALVDVSRIKNENEEEFAEALQACQVAVQSQRGRDLYVSIMTLANLALEKLQYEPQAANTTSESDMTSSRSKTHTQDAQQQSDVQNQSKANERIVFVCTDRQYARHHHQTTAQAQVPDICLVSGETAQRVNGKSTTSSQRDKRVEADGRRLGWHEILSFIEVHSDRNGTSFAEDDDDTDEAADGYDSMNSSSRVSTPALQSNGEAPGAFNVSGIGVDAESLEQTLKPTKDNNSSRDLFSPPITTGNSKTRKRKSPHNSTGHERQKKKARFGTASYCLKMARYGAQRLCALPAVTHSIGILVRKTAFTIWWTDREGTLETEPIDYIKGLPTFLVLLLVMQKFTSREWGIPPGFPTVPDSDRKVELHFDRRVDDLLEDEEPFTTDACAVTPIWTNCIHKSFQLHKRATCVYAATRDLDQKQYVLKISYPEKARIPEARIIRIAESRKPARPIGEGQSTFDLKKHLPKLLCSKDVDGSDTSIIRRAVGVYSDTNADESPRSRVLRLTVLERLKPITALCKKAHVYDFMLCWLQITMCRFLLWREGIQHGDPSIGNMAVYQEGNKFYGVLLDWDLAVIDSVSEKRGNQRTGTTPFMALDTLCDEFWNGLIRRVYRHDQEGDVWALAWTFLQFDDTHTPEKPAPNPHTNDWRKTTFVEVCQAKITFQVYIQQRNKVILRDIWGDEHFDFLRRMMQTYEVVAVRRSDIVGARIADATEAAQETRSFELPSSSGKYTSHQLELLLLWKNVHLAFKPEFSDSAFASCDMGGWDTSDDAGLNASFAGYTDFFKPSHNTP